jgi:lipoprotein-anchoring transpeptidase ErfK/SrfK
MELSPRLRRLRPFAAAALALVLVFGAASCSSDKNASTETATEETSTTTIPALYQTTYATAKGSKLTVLAELPKSVVTNPPSSSSSSSSTTALKTTTPPIPRNGLNSAGVKKTADGYEFTNPTYYKNPLVVVVLENQGEWMKVLITARPNHTTGWIKADDVTIAATDYRMELDLSTYHLKVFKGAEVFVETDVAIGKDSTPTPLGRFFVTEKIKNQSDTGVYGAWILPVNGYSEVLDTFDNGLPQVAFHGTNQPELIGTKASNGCVRISNDVVSKIAEAIPAGTPIDIFPTTPTWWTEKSSTSTTAANSTIQP